jgi:hypothetical protein
MHQGVRWLAWCGLKKGLGVLPSRQRRGGGRTTNTRQLPTDQGAPLPTARLTPSIASALGQAGEASGHHHAAALGTWRIRN